MRTINANLTTEQAKTTAQHTAAVTIGGTDYTSRLVGFTYREAAMNACYTTIWLDNTDQGLNSSPPARGATVDLERGCTVSGTAYKAELPRVWIEDVTFRAGYVILTCIDIWGKLKRWRCTSASQSWSATNVSTIISWILTQAGLSAGSGTYTTLAIDFEIPRGQTGDAALKRAVAKVSQYPYAGLDGAVKCKALSSGEASAYTYGWNANHPMLETQYTQGLATVNKVTVEGALGSSARYTGSAQNAAQITLAGTREKYVVDNSLDSNAECSARASAELDYYIELANRAEIASLPVHGLEIYDVITLATTPWGGTSYTARVGAYTEYYWVGKVRQDISLSHTPAPAGVPTVQAPAGVPVPAGVPTAQAVPAGVPTAQAPTAQAVGDVDEAFLQAANLPEATVVDNTRELISPESLDAYHTVGAMCKNGSVYDYFLTPTAAGNAFYTTVGRTSNAGDGILIYDTLNSEYRLYVRWAADTWVYFTADGTLVTE